MNEPKSLLPLRGNNWDELPSSPGVYWWYFPQKDLSRLKVAEFCDLSRLRLRSTTDGKVCLYHGLANNLAQRVKWHAAQKLTLECLKSGFISTLRLTLLALNDFDYSCAEEHINNFFNSLSISWQLTSTREEAEALERRELESEYHYPLNIQGNRRPEVKQYVKYIRARRKEYKVAIINKPVCATERC